MIPSRVHGVLDYTTGVLLILAPRLFGFAEGAASQVLVLLGVATIFYSLLTRYELGLLHVLPLRAHLRLDLIAGVFVAISPWLFGFADVIWQPHVVVGLFGVGASLLTRRTSAVAESPSHPRPRAPAR
jgi:hypothetical protein